MKSIGGTMRKQAPLRNLLLVDDEPQILNSLKRELRDECYRIHTAEGGRAGLEILKKNDIGVVLSDQMMPEMDGIAFLEEVKRLKPDAVRMILTAHGSFESASKAINRSNVFGYLTKPWRTDDLQASLRRAFEHYELIMENRRLQRLTEEQNEQLKQFNRELESIVRDRTAQLTEAVREGILMMAIAAEAKDDETGMHVQRVFNLTLRMSLHLGLSFGEAEQIAFSSMMHDVGKLMLPDGILGKPEDLTEQENEIMRQHTVLGVRMLGSKSFYRIAREIALSHHEHWDGSGYPYGLKGEAIPLAARIVAVADRFDMLVHARPYERKRTIEEARVFMKGESGKAFDPAILEAFQEMSWDADDDSRPAKPLRERQKQS